MNLKQTLKAVKLSITPIRLAIFEVLDDTPHLNASQISDAVKKKISAVSIQAVYKNLHSLADNNLIREIKPKGMPSIYETRIGDNHHHLVCSACGVVEDTNCLDTAPCLTAMDTKNFIIHEAEIVFWGTCVSCQYKNT